MTDRPRYRQVVFDSGRWDGFVFRDGDIVISTPPKCGTTWMQMICALLIFRTTDLPQRLSTLSPWLDMNLRPLADVIADLQAQTHRRFIKTHTPLDGLPLDEGVTYVNVARDPRDVAMSWDNHMANIDFAAFMRARAAAVGLDDLAELGVGGSQPEPPADPVDRFWAWVDGDGTNGWLNLAAVVHHVDTFWQRRAEPNIALFHYGDLRLDLAAEMSRLAAILGLDPPDAALVEAARFESMKRRAAELTPNADQGWWHDTARFFDQGRLAAWRDFLDADGQRRYLDRVGACAAPDLADWLHRGWRGADRVAVATAIG